MDRTELLNRFRTGYDAVAGALSGLSEADLDRSPAPGEWTPRMVIHHLADSEATAFIRLRRLVAENNPVIVGYDEGEFARRLHYERSFTSSLEVVRTVRQASLELLESL